MVTQPRAVTAVVSEALRRIADDPKP